MADEGFKRKLTAVFSADAVGYSRLMAEDEAATVKTIATYREIMASLIKQHRGRVVDSPGDNLLAEFSSVVDAVQCAVSVQNEIQTQNADLPDNRRMEFRIGVNLGDVIDEEDRLYGDGVNIAARLESLADPGGICVSKTAFDQIESKLPLGYEYLGEQSVKNIPKLVGAYRVLMKPDAAGKVIGEKRFLGRYSRRTAMAAIIILVIVAGGLIGWNIYLQQSKKVEPAFEDKMAYPQPDKPSIAVLPFENMSGDPEQQYFSDGITEQIITSISKVPYIFVIARQSSFAFRDKQLTVQEIAKKLAVMYILEGSLQRSGDRIRINVQLIDAISGHHLWAENYDRKLDDIFAVQDEICKNIMVALQVRLTMGEMARLGAETVNVKAYEKYIKGREHYLRRNRDETLVARNLFQEAIALDPNYAQAYLEIGWTFLDEVWFGMTKKPSESIAKAEEMAQKAVSIQGLKAGENALLVGVYSLKKDWDKAVAHARKAVEQAPNYAGPVTMLAYALSRSGEYEEAITTYKKALQLNPVKNINRLSGLAFAYLFSKQYENAISTWNESLKQNPDYLFAYMGLTMAYWLSDKKDQARQAARHVLRVNPKFSVDYYEKRSPLKDKALKEQLFSALREAGLK